MKLAFRNSLLISLVYCFLGLGWIIFSDTALLNYTENLSNGETIELISGILFVICSSITIFFLTNFLSKKYTTSLNNNFKAQQELLDKSEKRFRTIIEKTEDMIFLVDKDGNIIYISPAFERKTGFSLDEIKGKPGYSFIHPEQIEESKKILEEILNNPGLIIPRTNRFLTKNGTYICVEGTVANLLNDENIGAIVSNFKDVTEKKLIEKQAKFNYSNLKALINNTNDLMWSVDRSFKLITSNKAFREIVQVMSGRFIEKGDNILATGFSEKQLKTYKSFYQRAFSGESFTAVEHSGDSNDFWSEISFNPIYNEGIIIGTACFSRNITQRKLSEIKLLEFTSKLIEVKKELEHNELRLIQAQKIAHVGSWELNFKTGVILWSDELCRIYGVPLKENKHSFQTWSSFIHPEDKAFVLETTKLGEASRQSFSFHHRIFRNDGTVRFIYSQCDFDFDSNNNAISLHGVAHDVTEQKLIEQEILKKNDQLHELSSHLLHIKEEERALIAREIHDELGQQLTALKMDIGWVMHKQDKANEAVTEKLQGMLKFSDNLIATIRRISSDLRPAIIDDLGLIAALEWKCDEFSEKTKTYCSFISNVKERKFENDFSIVVYRILQESLTNIIRHAQASSVIVSVSENETELLLEITDDGKGISHENISKRKTLGILGMKERAASQGGKLSITGALNKGTIIKLKLPLK